MLTDLCVGPLAVADWIWAMSTPRVPRKRRAIYFVGERDLRKRATEKAVVVSLHLVGDLASSDREVADVRELEGVIDEVENGRNWGFP